ncbi:MAG TPA: cell division regulator GpsB [Bacillota bacterium]|nr:cell division regulator GpsB [Bacillota bacterium]
MEDQQIQLTGKEILEKDFKTAMRGYNQEEVDAFLDMIIQDYNAYQRQIDALTTENNKLKKDMSNMRTQPQKTQTNHQVNYDVLKRLSNLEKEVFGRKYQEDL